MEEDEYARSLNCALTLIDLIDRDPAMAKHVMLSRFVFAILAATRGAESRPALPRPTGDAPA